MEGPGAEKSPGTGNKKVEREVEQGTTPAKVQRKICPSKKDEHDEDVVHLGGLESSLDQGSQRAGGHARVVGRASYKWLSLGPKRLLESIRVLGCVAEGAPIYPMTMRPK